MSSNIIDLIMYSLDLTTSKSLYREKKGTTVLKDVRSTSLISSKSKQKLKRRKRIENVKINLTNCKYEVVKRIATDKHYGFGWKIEHETNNLINPSNTWDVYWCDNSITMRFFQQMRLHQVCNHFPGMNMITRKDTLAQALK